jgi:hypothetical protein
MVDLPERSFRQLFADLSVDVQRLSLQLATLAGAEAQVAIRVVTSSIIGMVAGVIVAFVGVQVLAAALVLGLVAAGLPPWAAALIGAAVLIAAGGGGAWLQLGRLRNAPIALPETRATLAETMTWLKAETQR